MFSRSSSNAGHATGAVSARLSAHLRSSYMRTPPGGRGGATTGSTADPHETPSPRHVALDPQMFPFERIHSARRGPAGRSDEETLPALELSPAEMEAEASAMTREELQSAVNTLRAENRVLMSTILVDREALVKQRECMRETYEVAEREGVNIEKSLTRRMDAVRRQKARLEARLCEEEALKAEQEQKLLVLRRGCAELAERLQREEEVMKSLPTRLQQLQSQRQGVENLLSEQSSSLQQLQELVDGLHRHTRGDCRRMFLAEPAKAAAESLPRAASVTPPVVASLSPSPSFNAEDDIDPARDPQEMLQYLKRQVSTVEALQQEACERAESYKVRQQQLEERIRQALDERQSSRQSLEGIHQELLVTTATVSGLVSAAEMAMEVEIDRQIHLGSRNASINSSSLDFRTPRRVTDATKGESTESTQK